mgnify:CR=1 FL=1
MDNKAEKLTHQFTDVDTDESIDSEALIDVITEALLDKLAQDVTILNVQKLTTLTDYFIVCHAQSDVQIKAIARNVLDETEEQLGEKVWNKEGMDTLRWVILDYVNVVVHIFLKDKREFYGIERMWSDAEITKVDDE